MSDEAYVTPEEREAIARMADDLTKSEQAIRDARTAYLSVLGEIQSVATDIVCRVPDGAKHSGSWSCLADQAYAWTETHDPYFVGEWRPPVAVSEVSRLLRDTPTAQRQDHTPQA